MSESQGACVKGLPRAYLHAVVDESLVRSSLFTSQNLVSAISLVGKQRMPYVPHVCTYLMCPARLQSAFHQGGGAEPFQYPIVCDGRLAYLTFRRIYSHLQSVLGMPPYVACDGTFVLSKRSPYEGIVEAARGVVEELFAEACLRESWPPPAVRSYPCLCDAPVPPWGH